MIYKLQYIMDNIDIYTDYYSFRNQLIEKRGDFYAEQSDIFFQRAVFWADKGLFLSAIKDARLALSLSNFQPENYQMIYLIGFLSQIYLNSDKIREAKAYCELGFNLLDKDDFGYVADYRMFSELMDIIKEEDWKMNL